MPYQAPGLNNGRKARNARAYRARLSAGLFRVDYFWLENGERREAHSVGTGADQADAERRFQRKNKHCTVINAASTAVAS